MRSPCQRLAYVTGRGVDVTPEMAFECLLVSRDPKVVCTLNRALDNLSITTKVCLNYSDALKELTGGSTDLVVIDCVEETPATKLLNQIHDSHIMWNKTVVAVSSVGQPIPGTYMVLRKPVTAESGAKGLKLVYTRLLQDHRRHARYAVLTPVVATNSENRIFPVTITNIGDGGLGLSTAEALTIGDLLSFQLLLPDARRAIRIEARVLWTREYGISGCEFVRIPPIDLDILHEWLRSRCRIKKPLISL